MTSRVLALCEPAGPRAGFKASEEPGWPRFRQASPSKRPLFPCTGS